MQKEINNYKYITIYRIILIFFNIFWNKNDSAEVPFPRIGQG